MVVAKVKIDKRRSTRKPNNYCQTCGLLIAKKRNDSWSSYDEKKYCNHKCRSLGLSKSNQLHRDEVLLPDGTVMPVAGYINKKTNNLRKTINFFAGVIDHVEALAEDAESPGKYKGFEITFDYYNKISAWLCDNALGKPGQRVEESPKVELSREEMMAGIKSLEEG